MGHHRRGYRAFEHDRTRGVARELLGRMPRWLKISLALAVVLVLILVVLIVVLVVLLLVKLLSGDSLPAMLQGVLDWAKDNLLPWLDIWKKLQSLTGGGG